MLELHLNQLGFPLLSLMIFLPVVGAFLLLFIRNAATARWIALGALVVTIGFLYGEWLLATLLAACVLAVGYIWVERLQPMHRAPSAAHDDVTNHNTSAEAPASGNAR